MAATNLAFIYFLEGRIFVLLTSHTTSPSDEIREASYPDRFLPASIATSSQARLSVKLTVQKHIDAFHSRVEAKPNNHIDAGKLLKAVIV